MEKIYVVYNDYGYKQASFKNKKDAINFAQITMKDAHINEINTYESINEKIAENPEYFIECATENLKNLMQIKIPIGGFKSKEGYNGHHGFRFEEIKEIVADGPDKLENHIKGFLDEDGNSYEVTKNDYHLFVEKCAEITNKIKRIKKYIKIAESMTNQKNNIQEKTF